MTPHIRTKLSTLFSNRKNIVALLIVVVITILGMFLLKSYNKVQEQPSQEFTWDEYTVAKDRYVAMSKEHDPSFALTVLREEIKKDDKLSYSCHPIVHELGHEAYEKYGSFSKAMKYQDELCNSGYLHGIIESVFSETKDIVSTMNTICGVGLPQNFASWQCYHGVGHGVMFFTDNDLPTSLQLCEKYKDGFARSSCVNGVFMENFSADQEKHVSKYVDEHNPMYPCSTQNPLYKGDCYIYAPTYYLFLNKNKYDGAQGACESAESGYQSICAQGVGSQAMKENINNPKLVERICLGGKLSRLDYCIKGMATLYVNHYASTTPAYKMCKELLFFNQETCTRAVTDHGRLFF